MALQTPFGIESELVIEEKKVGIIYSSRGISDDGQAGRTGQLVAIGIPLHRVHGFR